MRSNSLLLTIVVLSQGLSTLAWAENATAPLATAALCDPYLDFTKVGQDNGDEEDNKQTRKARYDLETSDVITADEEIMDAIYEEKWDIASGNLIERHSLCEDVPTYVVNWATLAGPGADGQTVALAHGLFSLRKDGTFQFDYSKRPYSGNWTAADHNITLTAPWLNGGAPLVAPVERVKTPIELTNSDGTTDSYTEEVYRIGPFRLMPVDTTTKGAVLKCACPVE